jgi:hypothetical protein
MDIAYAINTQSGGPVISPWEVDQLSQDWIDTILLVSRGLPKMKAGMREIEKIKAEIISKHSTYRPIPKRH